MPLPSHPSLFGALLLASLVAHSGCAPPPAPAGPRSTGASSRAFVGDAELQIRYRYLPTSAAELRLMVDLSASAREVGEVVVEALPDGFEPLGGSTTWTVTVPPGQRETREVTLRVLDTSTPSVTVVTTRAEGGAELARDTLRFIVDGTSLRECRPTDAACASP